MQGANERGQSGKNYNSSDLIHELYSSFVLCLHLFVKPEPRCYCHHGQHSQSPGQGRAERGAQSHSSSTTVNTPGDLCSAQETSTLHGRVNLFEEEILHFGKVVCWRVGWRGVFGFVLVWGFKINLSNKCQRKWFVLIRLLPCHSHPPFSYFSRHHPHHNHLLALLSCSVILTPTT